MGLLEKESFRHRSGHSEPDSLSTPCGNAIREVSGNYTGFAETPEKGDLTRLHDGCRTETTGSADVTSGSPIDPSRDANSTRQADAKDAPSVSFPTFGLAESLEMSAEDGTTLVGTWIQDRYVFLELIGQGGFGWVYRASQQLPKRDVAIKVPRHAARMSSRVRKEANLLGTLEHEAIARVYDAGEFIHAGATTTYVVMELIRDAQPIDHFCARNSLSTAQRIDLLVKVCDAVAHAHGKGIVHRDLKPSNILVDRLGRPRVIDFGIATFFEDHARGDAKPVSRAFGAPPITMTAGFVGTPKYMSPEQRLAGQKIDARSDVFALGKVLQDVVTAREQDAAAAPASRLTDDLEAIHGVCLQESPADRYADAGRLAEALRDWLAATERSKPFAKTSAAALTQPRYGQPGMNAALAAVAIVIATIFLLLVLPTPMHEDPYVQALRQAARALTAGNLGDAALACRTAARADGRATAQGSGFPLELVVLGHLSAPQEPSDTLLPASQAAADPSGGWLAAGDATGAVRLSRLDAPDRPIHRLVGLRAPVTALRFSNNARFLVGGDEDGRVCLWSIDSIETDAGPRRLVPLDAPSPGGRVCSVDISSAESVVGATDATGNVRTWDCSTGALVAETEVNANPSLGAMAICFGQNDELFIGRPDGTLFFWRRGHSPLPLHDSLGVGPISLARTVLGDIVASAGADSMLRAHRGDRGSPIGGPLSLSGSPRSAAWSLDGSRLLVACRSTNVHSAGATGAVDMFQRDPASHDIALKPLVTLPLPAAVSTLIAANGSCIAVFDTPFRGMSVWKNPPILNAEARHPAPP